MTALSKNRSLLFVGVFLFFTAIIFFSSVNAQEDASLKDAPRGVYILAQAPKPTGQQQASQPQGSKSKPGSVSGRKSALSKTTTEDDDDDEDDDEEDTQPTKAVTSTPSTSPSPGTTPQPPSPLAPSAFPVQVPPKPSTPPTVQAPAVKPVPSNDQPPTTPLQPAPQQSRQQPVPSRAMPARGSISLNFDDADVYQVIQTIFGDVLRVNYIVDPRVKGRVTFRSIAPIPSDQVLSLMEVILRINGVGVVEDSGLYRIVPIGEVSREPAQISYGRDAEKIPSTGKSLVQVIPILYLQSSEVTKLITPFLSANAVVIDVPKTNQIIIVDTDASVKRILQFLSTFDNEQQKKKQAQVYVYAVQNGKAKNVANLLQQIFLGARSTTTPSTPERSAPTTTPATPRPPTPQPSQPPASQQQQSRPTGSSTPETLVSDLTRIFADEILNSVIILATPEDYTLIKETIAKIDLQPRQVMIEGLVAQITLTDNFSLGLAYAFRTQFKISGDSVMKGLIGLNTGNLNAEAIPSSGFTFVGTVGDDVRAVINALATQSRAKVIAAPHILVTDNREARIQVGKQVPIVTSETYGSTTVAPQRTIQYKDIGIILKVTPQVNESGLVSLDIAQEVSTYETIELGIADKTIILNKAEATTNVVVKDGETIVIGGLIREDTNKSRTGVPWLSKIPLFGYLFGNTTNDESRQEIIILLTPRVVKTPSEAKEVTSDYVDRITKTGKGKVTTQELFGPGGQGSKRGQQVLQPNTDTQQTTEPSQSK